MALKHLINKRCIVCYSKLCCKRLKYPRETYKKRAFYFIKKALTDKVCDECRLSCLNEFVRINKKDKPDRIIGMQSNIPLHAIDWLIESLGEICNNKCRMGPDFKYQERQWANNFEVSHKYTCLKYPKRKLTIDMDWRMDRRRLYV